MTDSDDEPLVLSGHALAALQDFYTERDAHTHKFEQLRGAIDVGPEASPADGENSKGNGLSIDAFTEDWNESQFWYSDGTATLLARQLLDGAGEDDVIAVVSVPSVFVALRNLLSSADFKGPEPKIYFLEHDQRFAMACISFPEFIYYDLNKPFTLPEHLRGGVDRMICDPPFLSEDCQTKLAMTLRWLRRNPRTRALSSSSPSADAGADADSAKSFSLHSQAKSSPRIIICTGERLETLIHKLYGLIGVRTTTYIPVHKNGLQNAFYCYANFECRHWTWKAHTQAEVGESG